jgi:serine protease AprX
MRILSLLIILFVSAKLQAQDINRYMVFLTDKANNTYSLDEPEAFLSARSLERRAAQEITLTEADLPVSQAYINRLKETGAAVYYQSRWFNAALIEANAAQLATVESLPMVQQVVYVAPGAKLGKGAGNGRKQLRRNAVTKSFPPETLQNQLLGVPQMQEAGYTGEGKLVAVLDGGFTAVDQLPYFSHLFGRNLLLAQRDFTTNSRDVFRYSAHGTKALSTIAAIDSSTLIGTAPLASLMLAVTEDVSSEYVIEEYNWLMAAEWADSAGADVITASLGYNTFDDPAMNYTYQDMDGETTVSARAANFASERGILVVTSAGNSGNDSWRYIVTPADAFHILSVGAVTAEAEVAFFSSRGPTADGRMKPEVAALGVQTIVADPYGGFTTGNGTSFAAPQIAGFAAAVWQAYPELNNLELREAILESGSHYSNPNNDIGRGIPYFPKLQRIILSTGTEREETPLLVYPNPVSQGQVFIQLAPSPDPVFASLYSASGVLVTEKEKLLLMPGGKPLFQFNIQELQQGVYFLHLQQGKERYVRKIFKF